MPKLPAPALGCLEGRDLKDTDPDIECVIDTVCSDHP